MRKPEPVEIEPDAWCAWCGDPLPEPEERHHRRRFCCVQCREADKYDRYQRQPRKARLVPKPCAWCGTEFKPTRPYQKYCQLQCTWDAGNARARKRV